MGEGRLILQDGRTLAWREYGPSHGRPVLRFQGTPGSRNSRYPHEDAYDRLDARVIVADRPGYGASSRLPGRGISVVADDAAELLDHLGLSPVYVIGQSGGGPHALAFAAQHLDRVGAVSVVVGMVPLEEEDLGGLIKLNRDGWYAAREGWEAMFNLLAPRREERLVDPLAASRATMAAAPASDQAVIEDPAWQRVFVEDGGAATWRRGLGRRVDGAVSALGLRASRSWVPRDLVARCSRRERADRGRTTARVRNERRRSSGVERRWPSGDVLPA